MFRARLPSIFITCHKMLRLPHKMTMEVTTVLHLHVKCNSSSENASSSPVTQNDFRQVLKRFEISQRAKRSYARFETSKSDHFCRTPYRILQARPYSPHANGCGRLRMVVDANAAASEHTLNPQSETGTLASQWGKIEVLFPTTIATLS